MLCADSQPRCPWVRLTRPAKRLTAYEPEQASQRKRCLLSLNNILSTDVSKYIHRFQRTFGRPTHGHKAGRSEPPEGFSWPASQPLHWINRTLTSIAASCVSRESGAPDSPISREGSWICDTTDRSLDMIQGKLRRIQYILKILSILRAYA